MAIYRLKNPIQDYPWGPRLPFLLKVLASEKALALQVHPTRDQANVGFEKENARGIRLDAPERNYLEQKSQTRDALCFGAVLVSGGFS